MDQFNENDKKSQQAAPYQDLKQVDDQISR